MVGSQDHRDTLVRIRDSVVLVPVGAASSRGSAEDISACHTEGFGIGVPEWVSSALPSKTRNPDHQSACEISTEQRGSRSRFLNLVRFSVMEIPTPPSRGYTVTMLSCGMPLL